ncbi:unnamed protein product [Malus baccata var. baccata]
MLSISPERRDGIVETVRLDIYTMTPRGSRSHSSLESGLSPYHLLPFTHRQSTQQKPKSHSNPTSKSNKNPETRTYPPIPQSLRKKSKTKVENFEEPEEEIKPTLRSLFKTERLLSSSGLWEKIMDGEDCGGGKKKECFVLKCYNFMFHRCGTSRSRGSEAERKFTQNSSHRIARSTSFRRTKHGTERLVSLRSVPSHVPNST